MVSPRRPDADLIEGAKIVALTVGAGCLYGVLHDLVTTRVSLIYFTEAHPPIFGGTHDPTLLAFGWGVFATWWVGLILGTLLCASARLGSLPKLTTRDLRLPLAKLLAVMAILAGTTGVTVSLLNADAEDSMRRFNGVWAAHTMSYIAGFVGGIVLCALTLWRRYRLRAQITTVSEG